MDQLVSVGRIVHYVLPNGRNPGEHRPAIVVNVWGTPTPDYTPAVQLQVFTDSTNDFVEGPGSNGLLWATSVSHDEEHRIGTWHWPERV